MTKKFTTTPGVPHPIVASRFTAIKGSVLNLQPEVPAGERVAKIYPWISGLKHTVSGVANAETKIVREGYGSSAFVNTTDRFINIHQLRFFCIAPIGAKLIAPSFTNQIISNRLGVKVRHTDFEIVSEWLPCGMLATDNSRVIAFPRTNLCMTLPAEYYLQAGHPFRMRLRATNPFNDTFDYSFYVTLFGKDPQKNKPYELCKKVTIPYRAATSDVSPQYVDVVFDEDRDYPMRDMLLTHIQFATTPYATPQGIAYALQYIQQLDFQFIPPEGPKWMDFADWAPIGNLVDQAVAAFLVVYHPQKPIPFAPSKQIDIDVKTLALMDYVGQANVTDVPLWITLIGTQEQRGNL